MTWVGRPLEGSRLHLQDLLQLFKSRGREAPVNMHLSKEERPKAEPVPMPREEASGG